MKKKILLLSGYDAVSHRYWRQLLAHELPQFEWTQIALADRHYSWRVRGSSLNLAFQHQPTISNRYDLVIATSMVDLSSLRGFVPQLAQIPTLVYFHENQFVYPLSNLKNNTYAQANAISAQLTSVYSALCADKVIFNSEYNRSTFLSGARTLFKRLPDNFPDELLNGIENKSQVLSVPIYFNFDINKISHREFKDPPSIIWNHRWEYDKQPQVFFDALRLLKQSGQAFKLHVAGQSFRRVPECFAQAEQEFSQEILSFGFQSKEKYEEILNNANIVVSSALHDFQGLSLQQAMSRGCVPVAPNRVVYPEYVLSSNLYRISADPRQEAQSLFEKLVEVIKSKKQIIQDISRYSCKTLIPDYQRLFVGLVK